MLPADHTLAQGKQFPSLLQVSFLVAVACASMDADYIIDESRPSKKKFVSSRLGKFPMCPFEVLTFATAIDVDAESDDPDNAGNEGGLWVIRACVLEHLCAHDGEKIRGKRTCPFHPKMFVDVCINQVSSACISCS
jgi:hypothetical protein